MRFFVIILILVLSVYDASPPPPLQCPVPEDRAKAWYNGDKCSIGYSCCFNELIDNRTLSCCYAYGSDGPYKCCERASQTWFIILLSLLASLIGIYIFSLFVRTTIRDYCPHPFLPKNSLFLRQEEDDDDDTSSSLEEAISHS